MTQPPNTRILLSSIPSKNGKSKRGTLIFSFFDPHRPAPRDGGTETDGGRFSLFSVRPLRSAPSDADLQSRDPTGDWIVSVGGTPVGLARATEDGGLLTFIASAGTVTLTPRGEGGLAWDNVLGENGWTEVGFEVLP